MAISRPAPHTRGSLAYRGVRGLIRLLLWLFYRRIDVVGRERIPESGGVIVAANHHNSLVDAMLIIATVPRAITVLANAPLFRHPLIGPPLRLMAPCPSTDGPRPATIPERTRRCSRRPSRRCAPAASS